jgi:hypothetical protein
MSASREEDQADFDLERFIDMFDTAMTSKDPRVVETLRKLMMIVALTNPESTSRHDRQSGPLRRLFEDMHHLNQRMSRMDEDLRNVTNKLYEPRQAYDWNDKYTMTAVQNMAQSIDQDLVRRLSQETTMSFNGGKWPRGTLK